MSGFLITWLICTAYVVPGYVLAKRFYRSDQKRFSRSWDTEDRVMVGLLAFGLMLLWPVIAIGLLFGKALEVGSRV